MEESKSNSKGEFGGICNRTDCNNSDAVYYNHSTRHYYCEKCAETINSLNYWDALKLYGHNLCTLGKREEQPVVVEDLEPLEASSEMLLKEMRLSKPQVFKYVNHYEGLNMRTTKKQASQVVVPVRTEPKIGRNEPCHCGSGLKYKKCCMK